MVAHKSISGGEYIDLIENPEGFTGYAGESAHRIWNSIYEENCFGLSEATLLHRTGKSPLDQSPATTFSLKPVPAVEAECLEKRVYYRIISGLAAYYLDLSEVLIFVCRHACIDLDTHMPPIFKPDDRYMGMLSPLPSSSSSH